MLSTQLHDFIRGWLAERDRPGVIHHHPARLRCADPVRVRASLPALLVSAIFITRANIDLPGILLAIASGALASGLGYVIWYAALKHLQTSTAAVSQLTVPVITAILGILLLAEPLTPRVLVSGLAILTGIALVTAFQSKKTD